MAGRRLEYVLIDEVADWSHETGLLDAVYVDHFKKMADLIRNVPTGVLLHGGRLMNGASPEWVFHDELGDWSKGTGFMDNVYLDHFRKMAILIHSVPTGVLVSQNGEMAAILADGNRLIMIEKNDKNFNEMTQDELRNYIASRAASKGIEWPA